MIVPFEKYSVCLLAAGTRHFEHAETRFNANGRAVRPAVVSHIVEASSLSIR